MIAPPAFREYIEAVRDTTDIAKVIGSRLELDRHRKGKCPFHDDSTPSLSVNWKGQYFNCFGCGAGGDAFRFLELYDGLSFAEAVEYLALEAGIPPWESGSGPATYRSNPLPARRVHPIDEVLSRPDRAEVEAIWESAGPVTEDAEALGWFCHRHQCHQAWRLAEGAEMWDLARVIYPEYTHPTWARCRGRTWVESNHRLIFRLHDHTGKPVSIRARCLDAAGDPKSLAPAGHAVKGLVLADPLGVQILEAGPPDWWSPHQVVISEGEPDWLAWAARQSDSHAEGPAYIGIVAGGWSQEVADRIPDGAAVSIRVDHDSTGEKYAKQIVESLVHRCQLHRSRPELEVAA